MLENFAQKGKASFLLGGQWGSEGKGAAAAFVATHRNGSPGFDIVATNAGAQAGHTSTHNGETRVVFHLPTASLFCREDGSYPISYLTAGSIIDPAGLLKELEQNPQIALFIHPNAAVITDECRAAENRDDSAQTKIASTRKGVGEALSRKVLRSGMLAKDHPDLQKYIMRLNLNWLLSMGNSVLVEVPQGISLSVDSRFYPHTTSRNCTVMQAASDAGIHPDFYGQSMLVLRTFPIRVGNIFVKTGMEHRDSGSRELGYTYGSGGHYDDQCETSWEELGQKAEITTVTKRVRRVFTFSMEQAREAIALTRPDVIYLTFCDYMEGEDKVGELVYQLSNLCDQIGKPDVRFITQWGPTTDDAREG